MYSVQLFIDPFSLLIILGLYLLARAMSGGAGGAAAGGQQGGGAAGGQSNRAAFAGKAANFGVNRVYDYTIGATVRSVQWTLSVLTHLLPFFRNTRSFKYWQEQLGGASAGQPASAGSASSSSSRSAAPSSSSSSSSSAGAPPTYEQSAQHRTV